MLTLADVVEGLTGQRPPQMDQELTEVVIDSRLAIPGSLFIALRGERQDGHDFVPDALERGAIAAIVERKLEVGCWMLDVRQKPLQLPTSNFQPPACFVVEDSLAALQRLAAYWRAKHDVRVVGVTGSVGKPPPRS